MYGNTMSYLGFTKQTREAVWKMDGSGGRDDGALSDASGRKTVKQTCKVVYGLTALRERERERIWYLNLGNQVGGEVSEQNWFLKSAQHLIFSLQITPSNPKAPKL